MPGRGWRRAWIAALFAVVPAVALAGVAPPGASRDARKTLTRFHDPVIVPGARLAELPQRETPRLRLYRLSGGGLQPMPYQFDARDRDGLVALSAADFVVDGDDELVFMASDTGDRAGAAQLPPGVDEALEVEVADPDDGSKGWAYLLGLRDPPPPATVEPYVRFDPTGQRARSAFYEVEYAGGRNFFTGLRVLPPAGGTGQNLLRQTAMRGEPHLRLLLADLRLRFDEQSTSVRVEGTRNGPVRAVRRVRLSIDLGGVFPEMPGGTAETYHYRTVFDTPSRISVPWMVLKTLQGFAFENVVVFDPAALPLRYWDAANPSGVDLAAPSTDVTVDADHDWWVASGPAGTFVQTLEVPDAWTSWGIARGTVLQAAGGAGTLPARYAAGYSLLNMTRLRRHGTYQLRQRMVVLPGGYAPGEERSALAMVHAPLEVTIRRIR